ncbi:hypothetical protein [Anaerotignum sp.]
MAVSFSLDSLEQLALSFSCMLFRAAFGILPQEPQRASDAAFIQVDQGIVGCGKTEQGRRLPCTETIEDRMTGNFDLKKISAILSHHLPLSAKSSWKTAAVPQASLSFYLAASHPL